MLLYCEFSWLPDYSNSEKHEEWDASLSEFVHKYLIRPIQLLGTPIAFLMDLYSAFVYGMLYASLGSFPIAFQEIRGWNQIVGALPFLSLLLGILIGGIANGWNQKYYFRRMRENGGRADPEARLPPMMVGSIVFAIGLFIFACKSVAFLLCRPLSSLRHLKILQRTCR